MELRSRSEGRSGAHRNQIAPLPLHCYKETMLVRTKPELQTSACTHNYYRRSTTDWAPTVTDQ